jgi:hypothetical protein
MNPLIQLKKITSRIVIALSLACFAVRLAPNASGVVPAPDGGYPGGNTAEGTNALFHRTTGVNDTAVGLNALYADTTGSRNTALGVQALRANVAGGSNTAVGINALYHNLASYNTAVGDDALFTNSIGRQNTAYGYRALYSNATGGLNTAIGDSALFHNTEGDDNTAIGRSALLVNTTGNQNTATGVQALEGNTTGYFNVANGYQALQRNTIGFRNTAAGVAALYNNTSGSNNTALGNGAGSNVTTASNVICIGAGVFGGNVSNKCYIGSIYGQNQGFGAVPVYVNSSHGLGTVSSSRRFKEDIKSMDQASKVLFSLKPVTFHYKKEIDPSRTSQFGLVAEDVEKVNPDLVVCDKDGKPYTVRYDQVNAMLLNEFLKEHKAFVQEQHNVERLEAAVAHLTATVKEQAEEIRNVSMQLEASRSATQMASNNQ